MKTKAEFERFYQTILNSTEHLQNLSERERLKLKTSFLNTYNKYSKVRLSEEHRNVLQNLYNNRSIMILRQDKGRGVVLLDRTKYVEKAEAFLSGSEFVKLEEDPTRSFQNYVQRTLRSMKSCFENRTYERIYPSSSRPGLYFGLAKVHKLSGLNDFEDRDDPRIGPDGRARAADQLPLRPVISNIGTATYELSKYLAGLLKPLTKSQYSVESTKDFIDRLNNQRVPEGFRMVSFDVVSLFTKVPLDYTINIILDKVFRERKIRTKMNREQLKRLLEVCTKEMHFSYNGAIYRQVDGVAMGSPLGPVLANIFMVELENYLVPRLGNIVPLWFRYVDDTFSFVEGSKVDEVINTLNSFHPNIRFTSEIEVGGTISFLDVRVTTLQDRTMGTDIHRKPTDTNVYMNWQSFAPKAWKVGTLKGLVRRAFIICSTEEARKKELKFLRNVFRNINGYPSKVVHETIRDVERKFVNEADDTPTSQEATIAVDNSAGVSETAASATNSSDGTAEEPESISKPFISLPYKGKEGEKIIKQFRSALAHALPSNIQPQVVYTGTKIGSFFRIKDRVPLEHESNCVYSFKKDDTTRYIGETNVRYGERIEQHRVSDKKSSVYKYAQENNVTVDSSDFEILESGLQNKITRKLAESLHIKEIGPDLNERTRSFKLLLFN